MKRAGMARFHLVGNGDASFVWSRTAEAAAKKLYRAHKAYYAAAQTIVVASESSGVQSCFRVSDWCKVGTNKLQSKPKPKNTEAQTDYVIKSEQ